MNRLLTGVIKKKLPLVLIVSLVFALAAPVFAIEIPHGKTGSDFVREAKAQVKGISSEETKRILDSDNSVVLIDIRSREEIKRYGGISGELVVPHGLVIYVMKRLVPDKDVHIIIFAQKDKRSAMIASKVQQMGYENVRYLEGGLNVWIRKRLPIVASRECKIPKKVAVPRGEMPTGKTSGDFVAEANKVAKGLTPSEAKRIIEEKGGVLVDVRSEAEIESQGAIHGALRMEEGLVVFNIVKKIHDANTPVVVFCKRGNRSAIVAEQLHEMGYKEVYHIEGGFIGWEKAGVALR